MWRDRSQAATARWKHRKETLEEQRVKKEKTRNDSKMYVRNSVYAIFVIS
jgi:hypothetical protein